MGILSRIKILFLIFLSVFSINAFTLPEIIKEFDLRYYDPQNFGLKDLVFDVRISNLADFLNEQKSFGKVKDIYFRVYWMYPDRYKVEIFGMPDGFKEVRSQLIDLVRLRMDYVIPKKFSDRVKHYEISMKKNGSGTYYVGKDKIHEMPFYEINIWFDDAKLKRYRTYGASGSSDTNFDMSVKSWSHNKYVIDKMEVKSFEGMQRTKTINKFVYESYDGIGLPKEIIVSLDQEMNAAEDIKEDKNKRKMNSTIEFSNYKINKGIAKNYLSK